MTARVCIHEGQPWMVVEAPPIHAGDAPVCVYDGPLDLSSKAVVRREIDWITEQTGVARADLYDCIRAWQAGLRHGEPGRAQARQATAGHGFPLLVARRVRARRGRAGLGMAPL